MFRTLDQEIGASLTVHVDGRPVAAATDESVAAVLVRQAALWSRTTPVSDARGADYCMVGVCFDCLAVVDGVSSIQTCLLFIPRDETIACRCEELRVAAIRERVHAGRPGPKQVKAFTRAGMGPCQGRRCGYTVAHILAAPAGRNVPDVELYQVHPPLKPVTLVELAALDTMDALS